MGDDFVGQFFVGHTADMGLILAGLVGQDELLHKQTQMLTEQVQGLRLGVHLDSQARAVRPLLAHAVGLDHFGDSGDGVVVYFAVRLEANTAGAKFGHLRYGRKSHTRQFKSDTICRNFKAGRPLGLLLFYPLRDLHIS